MKRITSLLAMSFCCTLANAQALIELKTDLQDNAPKFMLDGAKKASGICIDLFNLLEAKEKIKFTYAPAFVAPKQIESNVENGIADVHCGWVKNDARQKIATFGEELFKVSYPAVVRANDKVNFSTLSDLTNLEDFGIVLGVNGVGSTAALLRVGGLKVIDSAKDAEQALKLLETGRGRVFIYTNLAIGYELQQPANKGKFKLAKIDYEGNKSFATQPQYMVFSKKVPADTVTRVNAALGKYRKEIDEIVKKYGGAM